jgi:hypothetical protein
MCRMNPDIKMCAFLTCESDRGRLCRVVSSIIVETIRGAKEIQQASEGRWSDGSLIGHKVVVFPLDVWIGLRTELAVPAKA